MFSRQVLNLVLQGAEFDRIRHALIMHDGVSAETERTRRSDKAIAPIAKTVTIAFDGHGRCRNQMIRTLQLGDAREVHVQCCDHRRRLREVETQLATDMDTHEISVSGAGR